MEALQQFIDDFDQHAQDMTNALRRAKVLTNDFHSPELDEWMSGELYGYTDRAKVPEYRRFPGNNYGEYAGAVIPGGTERTVLFLPTENLPLEVKDFAANLVVLDSVGALQAHEGGPVEKPWPTELVISAQDATALSDGTMFITKAYQYIEAPVYPGIVDQVKNRLFDFLLGVISKGTTTEESNQQGAVGKLVNYHIYGDRHVFADTGDDVLIYNQVSIVQKNDLDSLLAFLREQSVDEGDLQELKDAVSSEPEARSADGYGAKVETWRSKMMSKAAEGLWEVGVKTATEVLPKALNGFYGF